MDFARLRFRGWLGNRTFRYRLKGLDFPAPHLAVEAALVVGHDAARLALNVGSNEPVEHGVTTFQLQILVKQWTNTLPQLRGVVRVAFFHHDPIVQLHQSNKPSRVEDQ